MNNFKRMIDLVNSVFDTRNDDNQIQVTTEERRLLEQIHPCTLLELTDDNGPILWVLLVPTTTAVMNDFLSGKITEKELLYQTPLNTQYDAVYLCSATVLPEYRRRGLAKKAIVDAVHTIQKEHPVKTLFSWPFTTDGVKLAEAIADELKLPHLEKKGPY